MANQLDHEQMLSWADRCLDRVELSASEFMGKKPYIWSCDRDGKGSAPDTRYYSFRVRHRLPRVEPSEFVANEIGDTLHALRVSLDYLAVHVVMKAVPGGDEGRIAFPIFTNAADFAAQKNRRIPGIESANTALFNAFVAAQPYSGRYAHQPTRDPLAILDALEQPHKHRRMLAARPGPYDFTYFVARGSTAAVREVHLIDMPASPFGDDEQAEIARFLLETDAAGNAKADVQGRVRYFVFFDKKGPAQSAPAIRLLKEIRDRITNEIFPAFDNFI